MRILAYSSARRIHGIRPAEPYVAVAPEVLEQLDLAQGALGQDLLAEDIGDLLDGDSLVGLVVDGGALESSHVSSPNGARWREEGEHVAGARIPDNAVSTLAQLLRHGIPLIDDKILVEDLEDLAAL